jgi:hypothetical protein
MYRELFYSQMDMYTQLITASNVFTTSGVDVLPVLPKLQAAQARWNNVRIPQHPAEDNLAEAIKASDQFTRWSYPLYLALENYIAAPHPSLGDWEAYNNANAVMEDVQKIFDYMEYHLNAAVAYCN